MTPSDQTELRQLDELLTLIVGAATVYGRDQKDADGLALKGYIQHVKDMYAAAEQRAVIKELKTNWISFSGKTDLDYAIKDRIAELEQSLRKEQE